MDRTVFKPVEDRRKNSFIRTGKRFCFDRRQANRLSANTKMSLDKNEQNVYLVNIHNSGLCFSSDRPVSDSAVKLSLLPLFDFMVEGRIVWKKEDATKKEYVYGIEFNGTSSEQIQILKENTLINMEILMEYAHEVNERVLSLETRNLVYHFFLYDLYDALTGCFEIEKLVTSGASKEKINTKCAEVFDTVIKKGDETRSKDK